MGFIGIFLRTKLSNMEEQLFFSNGSTSLFGVLYQPLKSKNKGYLLIHPFGEEKKSSQRTLVEIAETLCKAGFFVFIFDLRGCGDSEGTFNEATVSGWVSDIEYAMSFFQNRTKLQNIGIIGLRFGAYLSMIYCNKTSKNNIPLILIEPVLHPLDYLRKSLRHKLMKELCTDGKVLSRRDNLLDQLDKAISVDFDGYELSAVFYKDMVSINKQFDSYSFLKNIQNGYLISISLTGKISKDALEIINTNLQLPNKMIKMELFWDKVDEVINDELISEVLGYCLTNTYWKWT